MLRKAKEVRKLDTYFEKSAEKDSTKRMTKISKIEDQKMIQS